MSIFPIIIDSRPSYLDLPDAPRSLALMPCGPHTILSDVAAILRDATGRKPIVLRTFDADPRYDDAIVAGGLVNGPSVAAAAFPARMATFEPSDWLLLVDLRCFSGNGFDPAPLLERLSETPRVGRHLVALDSNASGTNERVEFDDSGHVRRVQRYYDAVTWTVTSGVACSLIPVSSLSVCQMLPFDSLVGLRRVLTARDVPTRDIALRGPVFDLATERGLLRLNERTLHRSSGPADRHSHRSANIHFSARLIGLVSVHDDAVVEEDVTVIGPAVVGARARLLRGSVVAQSVVAPDTVLGAGLVVRHRVVSGAVQSQPSRQSSIESGLDDATESAAGALQEESRPRRAYPAIKTVVEATVAAVALVVISPLLLLIAALVKLESRGSVFYGDPRESREGKLFRCFKFRTMYVGADVAQRELMASNELDGPQFKLERDPRVTRLGRWLRALSLDELPQLVNVAFGEMSLVGPRPSPFRENQMCVPWRDARLSVRPGITGLWQVCRHDRASGDFHQWIYYDIKYVRNMSFWVDVKIIIATVLTLGGKGHVPLSWIIPTHSRKGA